MKSAVKAVLQLPVLVQLRRLLYERRFRRIEGGHGFRGVFETFEAAARSAPTTQPTGYDHAAPAKMYGWRPLFSEDYAVLFWLTRILRPNDRVFDYGGHAGSAFDVWVKHMPLPPGVRWQIQDVPEVVAEGLRRNQERTGTLPEFTSDFAAASGADILLASGSLQYVAEPLAQRLAGLAVRPRWLLLNQLPLHPHTQFATLQNIGTCFCPYLVFHEQRFFEELKALGYCLHTTWDNPAKGCFIPTYPHHTASPYRGALLELGISK